MIKFPKSSKKVNIFTLFIIILKKLNCCDSDFISKRIEMEMVKINLTTLCNDDSNQFPDFSDSLHLNVIISLFSGLDLV